MSKRHGTETITDDVRKQLRSSILTGVLAPGTRLSPAALGAEMGVSLGVIREALTQLRQDQLVIAEQNRGFKVFELSLQHLNELFEVRSVLEPFALRQSVENGDVEWESQVVAAHHRLRRSPEADVDLDSEGQDRYMTAHRRFHMALLSGCGNQLLLETCGTFWDAGELYRRWSVSRSKREWISEHAELAEACLDRDAERAVATFRHHLEGTVRTIRALMTSSG